MSKSIIARINGLEIKSDSIYKIVNRPDSGAPSGFVREGTTKLPSADVFNAVPCRYVITNHATGEGVYDTGFYEESPMYAGWDKEKVTAHVEKLRKAIVEPYERKHGRDKLDHSNHDFWDNYSVRLTAGHPFITSNVDDLLGLYIAVSNYYVVPEERKGDPKYSNAQYMIVDRDKVRSYADKKANMVMDAMFAFGNLIDSDRNLLINLLRYVKMIDLHTKYSDESLKSAFYQWLQASNDNAEKFLEAVNKSKTEKGKEEFNLYGIVAKLAKNGVLKFKNNQYHYEDVALGADLRAVSYNLANKKEFSATKVELLEKV